MRKRGPTWTPRPEDYGQVFDEQNPWHADGAVPKELAHTVERPLARGLWKRLQQNDPRRFQLILGPRRVGKSTAMYQTVRRLLAAGVPPHRLVFLRLDHPLLMQVSLDELVRSVIDDVSRATPSEPCVLFLDELTYARDWDLWLKTFYDEQWPLRIVGSSSATAALRDRRLESGVGRWDEQYLAPYLFSEFLELVEHPRRVPVAANLAETLRASLSTKGLRSLESHRRRFLLTGGFPELLLGFKQARIDEKNLILRSQRTLREDAVVRAICKDIPQAFDVTNAISLERLLYTLAGQVTGILSPKNICQNLGLSQPTFDKYVSYLERAFLVFALPNFSGSEAAKQKRGRKLYFVDGAVRNAALQRGLAPLGQPEEMGLLLENMVAGHLHALSQQSQVRLYHWRDGNDEVDLVFDHPDRPLAFEIASSASHSTLGLLAFRRRFPRFAESCYLVYPDAKATLPSESPTGIGALPLDLLLLAVSAQAERELALRLGQPAAF